MTVLGIHHLGLSVADLGTTTDLLGMLGFDSGEPFELSDVDAARGNGLEVVRMRVAFVSDGRSTFELIQHLEHVSAGSPPSPWDRGHERWHVLPGGVTPKELPGVSLRSSPVGGLVGIDLTAGDPAATGELLRAVGLSANVHGGWALPGAVVRVDQASSGTAAPAVTSRGRCHLAVRVADARATHALLAASGFDCLSAPIDHDGSIWWFFVRDPGGSGEIEIVQDDT